jgi:hypothetical protein
MNNIINIAGGIGYEAYESTLVVRRPMC